jgi:2-dehydro-3-deoxygluconokinase
VGRLIEDLVLQGGVEQAQINWAPYDGIGQSVRKGLDFARTRLRVRAPLDCSDRGHSAASQMKPGDIDWERIFERDGARWFHCRGIFAGLSDTTAALALEGMMVAREHGTVIS